MSECTHDCSSCGESCAERKEVNPFEKKPLHEGCRVRKVYGVVSGKGGVGKSMVTCQLAVALRREGYRTAILDADITGPSIPKAFGIHGRAAGTSDAIIPVTTATGIQLMSVNLLLEHETDPVIWRGPVIGGVVQQFWSDVLWDDVDYMFVDMPPGTGDVALNVFQSLPVDGVIIVASPHCRPGGEHELRPVSRLRQEAVYLRRGQDRGGGQGVSPAAAGQDAHRPGAGQAGGRRLHRAVRGPLAGRRGGDHPTDGVSVSK